MNKLYGFDLPFEDLPEGANLYDGINLDNDTVVDARYARIKGYEDNPDLCALPMAYTPQDLIQAVTYQPPYDRDDVAPMSQLDRKMSVLTIRDAFYPLSHVFELADAVDATLRSAYMQRGPYLSSWPDKVTGKEQSVKLLRHGISGRASWIMMTGATGTGKSVALHQVCSLYPKVIRHHLGDHEYVQIPILSTTCLVGNMSEMVLSFGVKLDELLDTGTMHADQLRKTNLGLICNRLKEMIKMYHIGMLVIDEVQFLNFTAGYSSFENVVGIAEETGCALGLIGNEETVQKIQQFPRIVSRTMEHHIKLGFSGEADRAFFKHAVQGLWKYQWTKEFTPLSPEILDELVSSSMYNIAVLKSLLIMVQHKAIKRWPKGGITAEYIHDIAEAEFKDIRSLLYLGTAKSERQILALMDKKQEAILEEVSSEKARQRLQALQALQGKLFSFDNQWKADTVALIMKNQYGYTQSQVMRALSRLKSEHQELEGMDVSVIAEKVHGLLDAVPEKKAVRRKTARSVEPDAVDAVKSAVGGVS